MDSSDGENSTRFSRFPVKEEAARGEGMMMIVAGKGKGLLYRI
jgi:hypothetical protein